MICNNLYDSVAAHHKVMFGDGSSIGIARAPGRVNIIGEHCDYNGLPVMPTAIDREIAISFSPSDCAEVKLCNVNPAYGERSFTLSDRIEPYPAGDWGNYAKAAAQALWGWAGECSPLSLPLRGFRGCVTGSIPSGSGLSSSSAMVVAAGLVIAKVNELPITKTELAELLAKGEQYVGTEGGGMDQAASLLSEQNSLLKIHFNPLRIQPVPVPEDYVFVIANSLTQANKAGGARLAFNTRVVECRLGLQMLQTLSVKEYPEAHKAALLGDITASVPSWRQLLDLIPDGQLTLEQVAAFCGVEPEQLAGIYLKMRDGSLLDPPAEGFQVKRRSRHALTEGERVELSAAALRSGDVKRLGEMMNDSHASCAEDYEISTPELDQLVAALLRYGALGARLTGAGFGGCAVALVERSNAAELLDSVWCDYYLGYLTGRRGGQPTEDRNDVLFICTPSDGAGVFNPYA